MKDRILYLDSLKGLLILLVIIGHLGYAKCTSTIVYDIIYSFHMPFFIFLSGIVIETIPFKKLAKRVKKLIVPFFIIGSLYSFCAGNTLEWLLTDTKYYFWYLLILAYCLILLFILQGMADIIKRNRSMVIVIGGLFLVIVLYIINRLLPKDINDVLSFNALFAYFPYFLMGHFIRISKMIKNAFVNELTYTVGLLLYFPAQYMYMTTHANYYHGISAICAIIVLFNLFRNNNTGRIGEELAYFGKRSMDIYLYHGFVFFAFNLEFMSNWVKQTSNYMIEILASVFISILIALVSILFGKLIKESSVLNYILYK